MMYQTLLESFSIERDAFAVNRGFYYQYLCVLKKWVVNFIEENDKNIFTEVDEDIKEVGEKLIFTQIKCYSINFSLNSKEVTKALFNFFILYLKERGNSQEIQFVFETNTGVAPKEKLLNEWVKNCEDIPKDKWELIVEKVTDILFSGFKKSKRLTIEKCSSLKNLIEPIIIQNFVRSIRWKFYDQKPEITINQLYREIESLLKHEKFGDKSPKILLSVLLSEIYKCSQEKDKCKRGVTNETLATILRCNDEELEPYINHKLTALLGENFRVIEQKIGDLQRVQALQDFKIERLATKIDSTIPLEKVPKQLTLLPYLNKNDIFGRHHDINELRGLINERRCVAIVGIGGMGKSTLANFFSNHFEENYNHIIWIDAQDNLIKSFVENEYLSKNLGLNNTDTELATERFDKILKKLNDIPENNLLIINNLKGDFETLNRLKSLKSWQILITTRLKSNDIHLFNISKLSFVAAKQLYRKYEPDRLGDDESLKNFFEAIDYNTLIIEIVAKTIHNSLDLNILLFTQYLKGQLLDEMELEIDIEDNYEQGSLHFFSLLQQTFNLSNLSRNEEYYLGFFALLPSEGTKISELVEWFGKDYEKVNKIQFANLINGLQKKGWIDRDGDNIIMHKMLQESIIYKNRKNVNSFFDYFQPILWLGRRFNEGFNNDAEKSARFLKYGESILHSIKESYRDSIYKHLLIIENEVLTAYNWLSIKHDVLAKWESLLKRAESHLPADNDSIGTMYNNYGLALLRMRRHQEAIPFFEKSIDILKDWGKSRAKNLLTAFFNLSASYSELNDLEKFKATFDKMMEFRKKYNTFNDALIPLQCNLLGIAFQNNQDFTSAIKFFEMAIDEHNKLDTAIKNNFNLLDFLNNLSLNYFLNEEEDKALLVINKAYAQLDKLNIHNNRLRPPIISTHILILDKMGNTEKVKALKEMLMKLYEQ